MKLIECYVENFGGLSDFKITFSNGINSIKQDNGYGKTTLTVFIKAMLFGLDDTRSKKLEINERKHYLPWQGGRCGGSLTFEANGGIYRIERTFMPKASEDTFKLYDAKSGNESYDFSQNIGEELFGIDADGFERTVFLSEANLSGKNENKTVSAKLSDLVGYDGDLSVMDEAIDLLEKERKVYYKRGGSGEIAELKSALSDTERKINDLERMTADYEQEKTRNAEISGELTKAKNTKQVYLKKAKIAEEARLKELYIKQYRQMKAAIAQDTERVSELQKFFASGVPTHEEIDEARESFLVAKRLNETYQYAESPEYTALSNFFKSEVEESEYEKAKSALSDIESKKTELRLLKEELGNYTKKDFAKPSSSKTKTARLFFGFGLLLTAVSVIAAFLISPISMILCPIGLTISLITLKTLARKKHGQKQRKTAATDNRIQVLEAETKRLEADSQIFIAHFPVENICSVEEALREIFKKHDIYSALSESQKLFIAKNRQNSILSDEYHKRSLMFLSRFPVKSEKPFDEIKTNLIEYESLKNSIQKSEAIIDRFAHEHSITSADLDNTNATEPVDVNIDCSVLDSRIGMLEREKTLSERRLTDIYEEIVKIDELLLEKEKLNEKISVLETRLSVIQKTKSYLAEAKDVLTSKYLSKTKSAFDKYIDLIGKEPSEAFNMNTSFEVMKNERGTLRDAEAYSKGTRNLYALAARFALIDSLYENEYPFIILDDPFAHFDDKKLKNALSALKSISKHRQIIYVTCTESRTV